MKLNTRNWVDACEWMATLNDMSHSSFLDVTQFVAFLTGLPQEKVVEAIDLIDSQKPRETTREKGRLIAAALQQKASMR